MEINGTTRPSVILSCGCEVAAKFVAAAEATHRHVSGSSYYVGQFGRLIRY